MKILSINCGSSTLKFRLYEMPEAKILMKGSFEAIGTRNSDYSIRFGDTKKQKRIFLESHQEAVNLLIDEIVGNGLVKSLDEIEAVGHRVVHGGNKYTKSVVATDRVSHKIESIQDFAPLHNPAALKGISVFSKKMPHALEVVCFDTAFHQTIKEENYLYSIPYEWYVKYDIRKYGFHGLSHKFISQRMQTLLNKEKSNLVICHIGNGASVSAIRDGICIDTSMGFTPNSGLMMGTRSGDIDYSLIGYVMEKSGLSYREVNDVLNKQSGLLGITGMSDLRDIDRAYIANDKKVKLAIDMYTRRIANYSANYY